MPIKFRTAQEQRVWDSFAELPGWHNVESVPEPLLKEDMPGLATFTAALALAMGGDEEVVGVAGRGVLVQESGESISAHVLSVSGIYSAELPDLKQKLPVVKVRWSAWRDVTLESIETNTTPFLPGSRPVTTTVRLRLPHDEPVVFQQSHVAERNPTRVMRIYLWAQL